MRATFGDCSHGSEMQCSAILENLCDVSVAEGHLPQEFTIAADNTRKETKNQFCMCFLIWLLCALSDSPLSCINVIFLLVGHTLNQLDRMCSRISVALRGKDYFTENADAAELGMEDRLKALLGATRSRDLHPAH